jgi:cytochrome c-type biogenesis protein CcmE
MTGTAIARPQPMPARKAPWLNGKIVIAGLVILVAVGYLIYSGMQSSVASYFVTVSELQQQSAKMDGQRVRVGGDVQQGSIDKGGVGEPITFQVTDGATAIPVIYHGVAPDIFADNVQVVVEGTYHANGTFEADALLTKCPSRFEAKPSQ